MKRKSANRFSGRPCGISHAASPAFFLLRFWDEIPFPFFQAVTTLLPQKMTDALSINSKLTHDARDGVLDFFDHQSAITGSIHYLARFSSMAVSVEFFDFSTASAFNSFYRQ